jgi:hypothetical protein
MNHPSREEIALWVLDPCSEWIDQSVREHLEGVCPACSEIETSLGRVLEDLRLALKSIPSRSTLETIKSLVPEGARRVLRARLVGGTSLLVQVREGEPADRYIIFRAPGYDIDVRIRRNPRGGRTELRGQIQAGSAEFTAGRVRILRGGKLLDQCLTDAFGEFQLKGGFSLPFSMEFQHGRVFIRTPRIKE